MVISMVQGAPASIVREKKKSCTHLHKRPSRPQKNTSSCSLPWNPKTRRVPSSKQLISHVLFTPLPPASTNSSTWLSIHAHHTQINRLYHQLLFLSSRNKRRSDSDGQTLGPSWVTQRQRSEERPKGLLSERNKFLHG